MSIDLQLEVSMNSFPLDTTYPSMRSCPLHVRLYCPHWILSLLDTPWHVLVIVQLSSWLSLPSIKRRSCLLSKKCPIFESSTGVRFIVMLEDVTPTL